jgi:PAS domain S-box-containing protein
MQTSSDHAVAMRADALYGAQRAALHARTDRLMGWLLLVQAPAILASAAWLAPRLAPPGAPPPPLVLPLAAAAGVTGLAVLLTRLRPGVATTRHAVTVAQMALSAVLLYATDGRGNVHLHAVGSFALIALYRDWALIGTASAVTLVSHVLVLARIGSSGAILPEVIGHSLWLALVDVFLVFVCLRAVAEMRASAAQGAVIEQADAVRAAQMAQLTEAEQRSAAMLRSALDAIVSMDERGGIVEFNPAAERLFGYRREEVVGRELRTLLVPPAYQELHRAGVERYFETGEAHIMDRRVEVHGRRADGTEVPIELALTEVRVPGGPRLVTGFMRDVTERQRADAALRAARDAAEAVNRTRSEFVANMGHEMRTPINALLGLVEVMRAGGAADEHRSTLLMMEDSARRLLGVINDLLEFASLEAGRVTLEAGQVSPRALTEEIHASFARRAAEKGLDFAVTVAPSVPRTVTGDAGRLAQVLRHLVDNAIKFTPRGRISVDVAVEPAGGAPGLAFAVRDTGVGIPADRQASIFEAFTQADGSATRRFGGTGLGLTLAAQLVALMGGRLSLTSVEGEGSTFRFVVPFDPAAERRLAGVPDAALERLGGDDELLGQLVAVFLESYPAQLSELRHAVDAGDAGAIRRRAQALRCAVGFLADEEAVEAAVQVEAAADHPGPALDRALQGLEAALARLQARLTALRGSRDA